MFICCSSNYCGTNQRYRILGLLFPHPKARMYGTEMGHSWADRRVVRSRSGNLRFMSRYISSVTGPSVCVCVCVCLTVCLSVCLPIAANAVVREKIRLLTNKCVWRHVWRIQSCGHWATGRHGYVSTTGHVTGTTSRSVSGACVRPALMTRVDWGNRRYAQRGDIVLTQPWTLSVPLLVCLTLSLSLSLSLSLALLLSVTVNMSNLLLRNLSTGRISFLSPPPPYTHHTHTYSV